MTAHCPCCGQAVAVDPVTATRAALTPMQRAIFDIVMRRPGLSRERLADVVYADDPQGGPDFAGSVISVHIMQANKRSRALQRKHSAASATNEQSHHCWHKQPQSETTAFSNTRLFTP